MNETKPWYTSVATWSGIIAVLSGLLALFGYQLDSPDQQELAVQIAGVAAAVSGIGAVYGRVKATKQIGPPDNTVARIFLPALLLVPLAGGGCSKMTPAQKLYLARQSYIGTEQAVTKLIRAGVIEAGPTLDAVEATVHEARDALAQADNAVGTLGFDFIMARVESALGRLAQIYLDNRPQPAEPGQPGATLWTPSRSSLESQRSRRSSLAPPPPLRNSTAGRTSPPRNRTHFALCRAPRTPTLTTP